MPLTRKAVVVRAPRAINRSAFLDAAYRMIDRAWVRVDEKKGRLSVFLTPRRGRDANIAADFTKTLDACAAQQRGAGGARRLRAAVLSRALELADRVDAHRREPPPSLSTERLTEIELLLAEAESAPKDPLGLRQTWDELRRGGGR